MLQAFFSILVVFFFRCIVWLKCLLSPTNHKPFVEEYVALKLFGAQLLQMQRLTSGYVGLRTVYISHGLPEGRINGTEDADGRFYETHSFRSNSQGCLCSDDENITLTHSFCSEYSNPNSPNINSNNNNNTTQGENKSPVSGMKTSNSNNDENDENDTSSCSESGNEKSNSALSGRPVSLVSSAATSLFSRVVGMMSKKPQLSRRHSDSTENNKSNDSIDGNGSGDDSNNTSAGAIVRRPWCLEALMNTAENLTHCTTLYRTGGRHPEILLVCLCMTWEPVAQTTRFACRLGSTVGCHTLVMRVQSFDGSTSLSQLVDCCAADLTASLAAMGRQCALIIGGCEVAAMVVIHLLRHSVLLRAPPLGVVLFDPFVGWRDGEPTDIGLDLEAPGAILVQAAFKVDAHCGHKLTNWFPTWSTEATSPSSSNGSISNSSISTEMGNNKGNLNSSTINNSGATPPEYPMLICAEETNMWLNQIRDYVHSQLRCGGDVALETYEGGHRQNSAESLMCFMEDVESWLEQVIAVRGFACGVERNSVSSTPSAAFSNRSRGVYKRFRSLATLRMTSSLSGGAGSSGSALPSYGGSFDELAMGGRTSIMSGDIVSGTTPRHRFPQQQRQEQQEQKQQSKAIPKTYRPLPVKPQCKVGEPISPSSPVVHLAAELDSTQLPPVSGNSLLLPVSSSKHSCEE